MKATGIIRRIDELGRIVIPKEIRKNLKIKEGSTLEIFINENGQLILTKVNALKTLNFDAEVVASSLSDSLILPIIIVDGESIVASSKLSKSAIENAKLSPALAKLLDTRKQQKINMEIFNTMFSGLNIQNERYINVFTFPIIVDSEVAGGIFVLDNTDKKEPEIKFALNLVLNLLNK